MPPEAPPQKKCILPEQKLTTDIGQEIYQFKSIYNYFGQAHVMLMVKLPFSGQIRSYYIPSRKIVALGVYTTRKRIVLTRKDVSR